MRAERIPFDWTAHQAESDRRHWEAVLAHKDDPNQVRVHGKVSHIGPEDPTIPHYMRGHGGGWYGIRFFDGREVESTNLWEQGERRKGKSTLILYECPSCGLKLRVGKAKEELEIGCIKCSREKNVSTSDIVLFERHD
jgi:hypothetical protein